MAKFNSWVDEKDIKSLKQTSLFNSLAVIAMLRSKGFYLTLPCNSSLTTFPSNTIANFKVKLPGPISLEGDWEVALVEMQYTHSWSTIREGNQQTFIYDPGTGSTTGLIESGHYNTVADVVNFCQCLRTAI